MLVTQTSMRSEHSGESAGDRWHIVLENQTEPIVLIFVQAGCKSVI